MKTDVIVIGSGFGGAVSAANLARAGMRVCILESGTWWGKSQKRRPFPESIPGFVRALHSLHLANRKLNFTLPINSRGLFEIYNFSGLNVIAGVGVGGSSLVYAGICQRPPLDFFNSFPAEITMREMEPYYQAIEEVLCPSSCPLPTERVHQFEKISSRLERAKFHPLKQAIFWGDGPDTDTAAENRWGVRQSNCIFCGRCTPGCNRGAKNSLDLNLIAAALKAGAEIRELCRVDCIRRTENGYKVEYRNLKTKQRAALNAPKVVVAAGTLNTHKILFRSQSLTDGLPELSSMMGKQFSLGGDTSKSYPERDFNFHYGRGHMVEGILEVFDKANKCDHYVFPVEPLFADRIRRHSSRIISDRTLRLVGFGRDNTNGHLTWNGRMLIFTMPKQDVIGRIKSTMFAISRGYGQTGSGALIGGTDEVPRPLRIRTSAHPMGGCRMGDTIKTGVVNHKGEVFGYPGLFIADASVFCGPPVCAPSLTVAALSWRISDLILESERGG